MKTKLKTKTKMKIKAKSKMKIMTMKIKFHNFITMKVFKMIINLKLKKKKQNKWNCKLN